MGATDLDRVQRVEGIGAIKLELLTGAMLLDLDGRDDLSVD